MPSSVYSGVALKCGRSSLARRGLSLFVTVFVKKR